MKALKKIEGREYELEGEHLPWPQKIDAKKAFRKPVKGKRILNRFLSILIIAIILILSGWLIFGTKPLLKKMSSPGPTPSSEPPKEEIRVAPAPTAKMKPLPTKPKSPPEKGAPEPALPKRKASTLTASEKKPAPPAIKHRESLVVKQAMPPKGIDASRFKLEAIVWSNNPKSRFAVINGRIIRKGGSIEGVPVTDIGRDYVAVKSGEGEWELRFRPE